MALFIGLLVWFIPIFWTISTSFKTMPEITRVPPPILPDSFLNFSNYVEIFNRLKFLRLIVNSLILCCVVVTGSAFFCTLSGYGFAKFHFPFKEVAFFVIVGVLMVPFESVAVPLFHWMNRFRLINTFPGLALPLFVSAFGVLLLREAISVLPDAYIEAARIDGASEISIFFRIVIPMIKPSIASMAVIKFMWTWNEFFWPLLVINSPEKATVTLGLSYLSNMYFKEYHLVTAAATLSLLPLFFIFVFLRKWMVQALMGVGIKS
jgi:multiple sugar transport system permease protein